MIETYLKYMGSGLIIICFFVSVLYLYLKEKRKPYRILFVYAPTILLILIFNPWFYKIFYNTLEGEIYFRLFWLLPVLPVIAYTISQICGKLKRDQRVIFGLVSLMVLALSGRLCYLNPLFSKAENPYHVPQEVVTICDAVRVEGREIMVAFPDEFLLYVRQYSADICMPYGRNALMGEPYDLRDVMNETEIDIEELARLSREKLCHYVVLSKHKLLVGNFEDYGFETYMTVGDYIVYKDTTMYTGL